MTLKYTYAFGRIIWNPHKFACERLSKIRRKSFLETGNEQIKGHLLNYCKKENGKKSLFEKQINQICDYKIVIDNFEISTKTSKSKANIILIINWSEIRVLKEWTPSDEQVDKAFKIMSEVLSLSTGCKVKFHNH